MQEDQVVVALSGERPFSPKPEDAPVQAGEPAGSLRFSEVAISPFVILPMPASAMNSCPFVNVPTTSGR
jgi:hypothetical protein